MEPVTIRSVVPDGPQVVWWILHDSLNREFRVRAVKRDGSPNLPGQLLASHAVVFARQQTVVYLSGPETQYGWRYLENLNPVDGWAPRPPRPTGRELTGVEVVKEVA